MTDFSINNDKSLIHLFDNMINAFGLFNAVFDENGNYICSRFIYINKAYEDIAGLKSHEVEGKALHEIWPNIKEEWDLIFSNVTQTGLPDSFELYHDLNQKTYDCNVYRPFDHDTKFCVVLNNTSRNIKVQEKIKKSEIEYKVLFESISDAVFIHPYQEEGFGNFVEVNDVAVQRYGYSKKEFLNMSPGQINKDNIVSEIGKYPARKLFLEQKLQTVDSVHITKDGKEIPVEITSQIFKWKESFFIMSIARDVTERKIAKASIQQKLKYEQLNSRLARRFIQSDDINESIHKSFAELGKESNACRVYVFAIDHEKETMTNTHEWCKEGVSSEINNLANLPLSIFPWWMQKMYNNEIVNIPDVSKLPDEALAEKEILESQGIKSVVVLPIYIKKKLYGFVGFDYVEECKEWDMSDKYLLRMLSSILSNAFDRQINESILATVFNNTGAATFIVNEEGRLIIANKKCEELLGQKLNIDNEHYYWKDFVYEEEIKQIENFHKSDLKNIPAIPGIREVRMRKKSGEIIYTLVSVELIPNSKEAVVSFVDITERKEKDIKLLQSEEKFKLLAETSPSAIFMVDKEKFVYVNRYFSKLVGYSNEELLGISFINVIHPEYRELIGTVAKEQFAGREVINQFEHKLLKKNGDEIWVLSSGVIVDHKGKKVILVTSVNINERKKAQENLLKEKQYLDYAINSLNAVFFHFDKNGKYIRWNKRHEELFGVTKEEMTNASPLQWYSKEDQERLSKELKQCIEVGHAEAEANVIRKDGSIVPFLFTAKTIKYKGEDTFIGVGYDITRLKESESVNRQLIYDMGERIKELKCTYTISKVIQENATLEEILQVAVNAMPQGWQYPDITRVKIEIFGKTYTSENFKESIWVLKSDIKINDINQGCIYVYYIEECPKLFEGPFLKEERSLLNGISVMIGETIAKKQSEQQLIDLNNTLEDKVKQRTVELEMRKDEIMRQTEMLSNTIESLSNPFYVVDTNDYSVILANKAAKEFSNEYPQRKCHQLSHRSNIPCNSIHHPCPIKIVKETKKPVILEHIHYDCNGDKVFVEVHGYPIFDQNGEVVQMIEYTYDITDRKKVETELKNAKQVAEAATKAKSDFLANMSHEIRTPMQAIIGLSKIVLKTNLNSIQHDYLLKIEQSSQLLLRILNDILDFSKIEAGKLGIELNPFNLEEVLKNVAQLTAYQAQQKGIEFLIRIDKQIPKMLKGDALRITQVLSNFCSNAVKFTHEGEIFLEAKIIKKDTNNICIEFSVSDTGIGLSKDQQKEIFKSFSQADKSITRKYGGTGLGLAICKNLAKLMNGDIYFESEFGKGSKFYFRINFEIVSKYIDMPLLLPDGMQGMKVLICTPNKKSSLLLRERLERFTCNVEIEYNFNDLLNRIESENRSPFKLVIIDLENFWEDFVIFYQKLKEKAPDIPVVLMINMYDQMHMVRNIKELGLENILIKPVTCSPLFNSIIETFGNTTSQLKKTVQQKNFNTTILKGINVLLVEDNLINQQIVRDFLEEFGVNVEIASNGKEAVDKVKSGVKYDLVLMDIRMPVMDGYTTTINIRKLVSMDQLPIIAMTADAVIGVKERCLEVGMQDFIIKPLDPKLLFNKLEKWCNLSQNYSDNISHGSRKKRSTSNLSEFTKLEVKSSLARFNNDPQKYLLALNSFKDSFKNVANQLQTALIEKDYESLYTINHTLKGVSANLGIKHVYEQTKAIGEALKEKRYSDIEECISLLDVEFQLFYNEMLLVGTTQKTNVQSIELDSDTIKQLKILINNRKPEAKSLLSKIIRNENNANLLSNLETAINNYNFKDANKILSYFDD